MNSVDESIAQSIVFLDNAIDVWNELKEHFSQGDYIRISELQCEIYSMKQDSRSVSEFFTTLKSLWEELESYFPTLVCSCPMHCICNTGIRNAKHQHEVTRSIRFLTGLNDNFDSVRAQILLMNPLPAITRIFSMIIQQERHYNSNHYDDSKVLVNASDSRKPQGRGRGYSSGSSSSSSGNRSNSFGAKNKECSFCGKTNHIVENCYRKHEFPPHYGKSNASTNNASQEEREDVGDNQGSSSNAGNQGSSSTQVNIASGHVTSGNLVCTLHSSPGQWIIDTCASDHICSFFDYFSSYKSIKLISVKLPNGQVSIANYSGSVKFSSIFTISHVLLVPDFNLNLISVPKLGLDNHFLVSFDNNKCLGMLNGGLCYFNQNQVQPNSTTIASSQVTPSHVILKEALWHYGLGHLSNSKLLDMHKQFSFVKVDDHAVYTVTPSTPIFDDEFLVTTQSHIPNSNSSPSSPSSPSSSPTPPPLPPDNNDIVIRKSTRLRSQPSHLNDYVCNLSDAHSKSSSQIMLYPISHFHSCVNLSTSHTKFVLSVNNDIEPSTYKQASLQDYWVQAMNAELHALQQNKTWILVDAPPNVRPIGSR
ncbi:unnamed protein product [Trifolium pratense]|uniref:Uncharacterized protein n=1 Tax=Trifolium pratense TaxID=57577 RepID=A0ACB0L9S4_TRIPR|nr:unnamed protein product [Trifolium pratense]